MAGEGEKLVPSVGVGETVGKSAVAVCGSAAPVAVGSWLRERADAGDRTGVGLLKTWGPDAIDGKGVDVERGIAVGGGLGAEVVPHPASPSMTTNASR